MSTNILMIAEAIMGVVAILGWFQTRKNHKDDTLAKEQRKEQAHEDAVKKLENVPWLYMADAVREQEPSGDWERKIREQRGDKLRAILNESYKAV